MDLRPQLNALLIDRPAWYRQTLTALADRLRGTACELVLRAGDPMPDFVLPNAEGELVFSDDLLARGPLVLCFFRGSWCPFCNATLRALEAVIPEIRAAGATLIALTPDTSGHTAVAKQTLGLTYEILSDVDSAVGLRFGTVYRVPAEYRAALLSFGIDLAPRHGDDAWLLPMPATFVCETDGILRYAHASGDVTDRTEPATIVGLLRSLMQSYAPSSTVTPG